MDHPFRQTTNKPTESESFADDFPPGNHALEIAARQGFGPLSPLGREVWHGDAMPCVTCGQLVRLDAADCQHCGQDLSAAMIEKMRAHAGPWYVWEHVRPFPGISLSRLVRQIRRGLLTETSIVRGPATDHQWRFATAVPGLCRYFSCCWKCHKPVTPSDTYCRSCRAYLLFDQSPGDMEFSADPATTTHHPDGPPDPKLRDLKTAVHKANVSSHDCDWEAPRHVGGVSATWIIMILGAVAIILLLWVVQLRSSTTTAQRVKAPDQAMARPHDLDS